jgi:sulfite reductase alpha subunit-like flavoprotein
MRNDVQAQELYLLSSIKGKQRFQAEIEEECVTIMDLLEAYPSTQPPLALLLQMLPALSPRYYSIASSPLILPSRVRIAFSVVSWTTPKVRKPRNPP